MTPKHERSEQRLTVHTVPDAFQGLDIPWYGGGLDIASDTTMTVSYLSFVAPPPEQLHTWWIEALQDAGWTIEHSSVSGNGRLDAIVVRPDGRRGLMTIRPEGSLWWVILTVDP